MKYLRVIILIAIQTISGFSFSQTNNPKFSRLTTSDGLSQVSVFAILKDHKGFMWFGTNEGLNKYDGYKFTVYKHNTENEGSIDNNAVYGLMEDAAHNLWVLTPTGLDKFDRLNETFTHYRVDDSRVIFRSIFQDSKQRIWLGTTEGFCQFNAATGKFSFYKKKAYQTNSLSHNYVSSLTADNDGDLWIGTRNGLTRYDPETETFTRYVNDPLNSKSIGAGYIKKVYKDARGNIWIGTQGSGVSLYNSSDNSFTRFKNDPLNKKTISHNDILSFAEDREGKLWVGTENGGISVFDYSTKTFTCYENNENDEHSLSGNSVYSLYKDDLGNMWAGTWSGGVNFLPFYGDKFRHYKKIPNDNNSLSNNLVLSISKGPDNNVWIGTDGGGLNRFDPVTHNFERFQNDKNKNSVNSNYVMSISTYSKDLLALGYHHGGMDLFDIKRKQFSHYPLITQSSNMLTSPSINIIYTTSHNDLWIGTSDNFGIYRFDMSLKERLKSIFNSTDKNINGDSILLSNVVVTVLEDKKGNAWIGTESGGLTKYDPVTGVFSNYQFDVNNKNSLSNNAVYSIMEDHAGNLWIGTAKGLNLFDAKTNNFTAFTEKDGLPNNTILSTQEDRKGNLWISTNNGLSRFTPSTKLFRNYSENDGLQNNTFKAKASYQLPSGEMFFGGVNGFNTFFPDSIKENDFVPPVYLTGFQVFNKSVVVGANSPLKQSINEVKEITLLHSESVFTIEFAALNFTQSEKNKYAYKLEGFDNEWSYVGNKRSATYTNLDPGTYIFKVKASNNDGVWNEAGTSVKIIITPPFWRTWWFMMVILLLIVGSGVGFYLFRMNIVEKQKILLEHKVKEQTIQLVHSNEEEHKARLEAEKARLETIKANEDLANKNIDLEQFVYIASHDLREPLRTTSSFVELLQKQYKGKLDEKADTYLTFITESAERMKTLINDLLDYSRIASNKELMQVDCNLILKEVLTDLGTALGEAGADITSGNLPVIRANPTGIKQLFQNLVANGIKFMKKDIVPKIHIEAEIKDNEWKFSFADNGIGMEQKHIEKIFTIFQRLHNKKEYEGSGIGLAHCKKIVELHHGRIWAESVPGEGSVFHFTIHRSKS